MYECHILSFLLDMKHRRRDARKDQTQVRVLCFDVQEIEFIIHTLIFLIDK